MATPIIQIKRGSGNPSSLSLGELAFDTTGKSLLIGTAAGLLAVGGELVFAKKIYADAAVTVETNRATAAEGVLTSDLASEVSNRTSADTALGVRIDNILTNTTAGSLDSLTEIVTAFQSADSTLNGAITALSSAASTGLTNEVNRATAAEGVLTTNLANEVTRATAAEGVLTTDLASEVTRATGAEGALSTRIAALEGSIDGGTF
jgi:anti-sigma factor ChrR (cupin superfamily)